MAAVRVRELTLRDLDRILAIDQRITKVKRKATDNDLWRLLAETTTCFGAEVDGRLVGFVLADVRPWEFGVRQPVGWIIALGVDPKHQKAGIGRKLGERVLAEFRKLGVGEAKTLVGAKEKDLAGYFESLGFKEGGERVLSLHSGPKKATTKRR